MSDKKPTKKIAKTPKKETWKPDDKAKKLYDFIWPILQGLASKGGNWRTIRDEFKRIYQED
jgi:hypothetical protein